MFVWHAGEEGGLRGSRFNADRLDPAQVAAALNIDNVDANASLPSPLELDWGWRPGAVWPTSTICRGATIEVRGQARGSPAS